MRHPFHARSRLRVEFGAVLAATAAVCLAALYSKAAPGLDGLPCRAAGSYVEVCSCARICETALEGGPRGKCAFVAALHVDVGQRGETPLSGLSVAVVGTAAEGRGTNEKQPIAAIYVDKRANPAQVEALAALVAEKFGDRLGGPLPAPRPAMIRVERNGELVGIGIEGVADLRARPILGLFHRAVSLQHAPGAAFPFLSVARGTGGQVSDSGVGVRFDAEGKSVFYGKFDMASGTAPPKRRG